MNEKKTTHALILDVGISYKMQTNPKQKMRNRHKNENMSQKTK